MICMYNVYVLIRMYVCNVYVLMYVMYGTLVHCALLIPVCSTADLDRKLSLRRDRDELIKQGIIKPPEGEMLEDM